VRNLIRALAAAVALAVVPAALAHARMSPAVSLSGELQLYSLAIPTEKEGLTTQKIVLSVPKDFGIDSFVPSPGWTRQVAQTGSGDSAVVQTVTWTGGNVPTGEDSLFQFLAQPSHTGTYTFDVVQTYSDGSIVDWSGPESSAAPAPTIQAVSSIGGSNSSTLGIVAIVLAVIALIVAVAGLLVRGRGGGGGGRELA
jgi:uncharacterized protein YcnI